MASDPEELKRTIRDLSARLNALGPGPDSVPEFTLSANAVRKSEYLAERDALESELIRAYARYAEALEEITAELAVVGRQMVELLRLQTEDAPR